MGEGSEGRIWCEMKICCRGGWVGEVGMIWGVGEVRWRGKGGTV